MKKLALVFSLLACSALAMAQLSLPQPSPKAMVMQTIGYTDVTIDYSSPAVKGRTIWGDLVPYDKVWRAGANASTKITFSRDVQINGGDVPKGTYSLFIIPTQTLWTVCINKDVNATADQYKAENDIARFSMMPQKNNYHERLAFSIVDFTNEKGMVTMEWEQMKISFEVFCATTKQTLEAIEKATGSTWQVYNNAARYYLEAKDFDKALGYANQSIALSEQWFNVWIKAQIMAGKGDTKAAYALALRAKELGDKNPQGFFFKNEVEKALLDWKPADTKKKK